MLLLKIADFSKYPSGRDHIDGYYNGTRFRQEMLLPAIIDAVTKKEILTVSLEHVNSLGSSFLEESFGGLVRKERMSKQDIKRYLRIIPNSPPFERYVDAIWRYIESAK